MKKNLLLLLVSITFIINGYSQSLWSETSENRLLSSPKMDRASFPTEFKLYSLNLEALKSQLLLAPSREISAEISSTVIVGFPNSKGNIENFRMFESSVMHPDLASRYSNIKTYVGKGIEDPTATIHVSVTIFGLHAMVLSGTSGTKLIDTYTKDLNSYIVYDKHNLKAQSRNTNCLVQDDASDKVNSQNKSNLSALANDGLFRTYRLAMACTIEYAAYHITAAGVGAGTLAQRKAAVLAAMNVTMTRLNGIYERDMSLRMQFVPNNDVIIFVDSDAFTNDDAPTLIGESQSVIDGAITSANYDIGHTVSTGGGGLASSPSVCVTGSKARGITGSPAPVGDPYDIDFVAHEIGHQFGGSHTFSGDAQNCAGTNRSNANAVEPGSGTTIMAYAGICAPQDVQPNSDAYFHAISLAQMFAHITSANGNCAASVSNGNNPPVLAALTNFTIPNGTAFRLTAPVATDANGDAITYCWEQTNTFVTFPPANASSPVPTTTALTGSNFRSYSPTASTVRNFPRFSDILAGNLAPTWEKVPTVARTMNFAVTARDNRSPNGGQTARRDMVVTFAAVGPFTITAPNINNTSYPLGSTQTITWNVAGTTANNINTANVNILFSTDGGLTFPTVLASNTPNDGSQAVTLPSTASPNCRIMIEAVGNIFFAVSKNIALGFTVTNICNTYAGTVTNATIDGPDTQFFVLGSLTVPAADNITISDLNMGINITHANINDLYIGLVKPNSTIVDRIVYQQTCASGTGIVTTFDDAGVLINCAGITGGNTYQPLNTLDVFNGGNSGGLWRLAIADIAAANNGTLNSWSLNICSTVVALSTENFGLENFTIYPNPNNGNFTIQFDSNSGNEIKVGVNDMTGREVFSKSFQNSGLFNENVQLNNLQAGVYLVNVQDGSRKEVKKIIIE